MSRAWLTIEDELEARIYALATQVAEMRDAGETIMAWRLAELERYRDLLGAVQRQLGQFGTSVLPFIREEQRHLAALGVLHSAQGIRGAMVDAGLEIPLQFNIVPTAVVETMVGMAGPGFDAPLAQLLRAAWPDAVDGLTNALVRGIAVGDSPRVVARAMADGMTDGLDRMMTIARTEMLRTYREASRLEYEQSGVVTGYRRIAAHDADTCLACIALDGEEYETSELMEIHPNDRCLVPGTLVSGPKPIGASSRYYQGDVVVIRTASGNLLTATEEHPILTDHGWVRAGLLQEGDNVVSTGGSQGVTDTINPDHYQVPTRIEEIAGALDMVRLTRMPESAEDLDPNREGPDVQIVWANRLLRDRCDAAFSQPARQKDFGSRNVAVSNLASSRSFLSLGQWLLAAAHRLLGHGYAMQLDGARGLGRQQLIGARLGSAVDTSNLQPTFDGITTYAEGMCERILGFASKITGSDLINRQARLGHASSRDFGRSDGLHGGLTPPESALLEHVPESGWSRMNVTGGVLHALAGNVHLDRAIQVGRTAFSGHVYNLQTTPEWYIANGIITHNCAMVPTVLDMPAVQWQAGQDWLDVQPEAVQREILGPARYDLYSSGQVTDLRQFVATAENETWGPTLGVRPLEETGQ